MRWDFTTDFEPSEAVITIGKGGEHFDYAMFADLVHIYVLNSRQLRWVPS